MWSSTFNAPSCLLVRVMGASEVVGADIDDKYAAAKASGINHNFEVFGFTSEGLSLSCTDVQALVATKLGGRHFDAIVSDLPYGKWTVEQQKRPQS